jgi:competence protein ComEC
VPLAAIAFCCYAAGLAMGFGGASFWASVALVLAGIWAMASRRFSWAILSSTSLLGVFSATIAIRADERCIAQLRAEGDGLLRLRSPLAPGRAARAQFEKGECRVQLRLRGGRAHFAAGSLVSVQGILARSGGGVEMRGEHITLARAPGLLARMRGNVAARIDTLFGTDAPLARALLLADADDIDRDLRDRFADAGIVHMLSVSGLHVAIIANALRTGALAAGMSAVGAEALALGTAIVFVAFIGAPPPAARSVAMLVLIALARQAQRPTAVWGVWGVSSAISLVDPRVVLDLGWQLSVTGMAGLLASAPLARRCCGDMRGWKRSLASGVLATTVASLATAPLVAWVFGRVSLIALVTNVMAAPLFEIAQPLLFATVLVSPLGVVARLLADAGRGALWLVDLVARFGAAVPMGVVTVQPSLPTTLCLAVSAVALVIAAAGRWPRRPLSVALGAGALACWWPQLLPGSGRLELHMLDVGQGDAIALRTPRGRWVLVDAGGVWGGGDAARRVVLPYLRRRGGDVVLLATTHPHADHIGGAPRVIRSVRVDAVWDGGYVAPSSNYRDVLTAAQESRTPWRRVSVGDSVNIDGVSFVVLAPETSWIETLRDPNAASLVLRVSFGRASFLLTGDGGMVARAPGRPAACRRSQGRTPRKRHQLDAGIHRSRTSSCGTRLSRGG